MREAFRCTRFNGESLRLIGLGNDIIEEYQKQGLKLTLRQLYYQFVSRNFIPNNKTAYKNLASLVANARLAGHMDWAAIEDRGRQPKYPPEWNNLRELFDASLDQYRLPRWVGQEHYVELWVEKEALAGVLQPLALEHHVTLMVNKGYSSASAMYAASKRIINACNATLMAEAEFDYNDSDEKVRCISAPEYQWADQKPIVFYLGDHDPSGEDMVRDIRERLIEFGVNEIDVRKLALTTVQVKKYNPPPNPAKITDPRAARYIAQHGPVSWEVDALPPNVLAQIVRREFRGVIDVDAMDAVKKREEKDKKQIAKALEALED